MILRTYTRVFTPDLHAALPLYQHLVGRAPDFHVTAGAVEVVALGNFLIIAGADAAPAAVRSSHGTIVVDNLDDTQRFLETAGAVITQPNTTGPTGHSVHARHPDGTTFEGTVTLTSIRTDVLHSFTTMGSFLPFSGSGPWVSGTK